MRSLSPRGLDHLAKFGVDPQRIVVATACVETTVKAPLSDHQFAACVSLCADVGCAAFKASRLATALRGADYAEAARCFILHDREAGSGVFARRAAERQLFTLAVMSD